MKPPGSTRLFVGLIIALVAGACSNSSGEDSTVAQTTSTASVTAQSAEEHSAALRAGTMPDLRGWDLNELGDGGGVLYPLQDLIGIQTTKYVASDEVPAGGVVGQSPDPGSPLEGTEAWALEVSDGGPTVPFSLLPTDAASFARTLPGFDVTEDLIERTSEYGNVYKSDMWLFGLDCRAVESAYRTFLDGSYSTACAGERGFQPAD